MKKIYVDQLIIKTNERRGEAKPPIKIESKGFCIEVSALEICGPSRIVYEPGATGPRVWVETDSPLKF